MLRLFVAWRLLRVFRVALAAGVVLALGLMLVHGQFAAAGHTLGSGFSSLGHDLRHDVQGAVQHALRPVPGKDARGEGAGPWCLDREGATVRHKDA